MQASRLMQKSPSTQRAGRGAQFHARRGLALWQIQYVGRWGGNTVEQNVAEAFAEIRADWAVDGSVQREAKRARSDERQEVRLAQTVGGGRGHNGVAR